MRSKKIWYISKYALNPKYSGPQRQYLFSKYFANKGFKTILISSNSNGFHHLDFKGKYKLEKDDGFKHYILKGNEIDLGFSIKRIISWIVFEFQLSQFLKKQEIDKSDTVIVSSLSILSFLTGVYLKKKHNVNLIIEVRDIWPQTLIDFKNISKNNPIIKCLAWVERTGYKYADLIIGTMGNLNGHVKKISPGCEKKVRYIPMGFDQKVYGNNIEKFNTDPNNFIAGYAGTIGQANNVKLILETARLLKDQKNIKFRLLGDGVFKEKYIIEYSDLNNVEFLPKVAKNKVVKFLISCDILLNPWEDISIYKYGVSPNKWIDYMYAAKPIIVPYNGFKNIINEAECGEFIETNNPQLLADTILKYCKIPKKERERIGLNGREYLESNLTYDILSDKYLKLIEEIGVEHDLVE